MGNDNKEINDSKEMSLEETFEKIDTIMEKLSDDEMPLEDSFTLYKEGMEMLSHARSVIDEVEKKVIMLSSDDDGQQ